MVLGVGKDLEMILSHVAPSCLDMSLYRATWTHFKRNSVIFVSKCLDQVLDVVLDLELIFGTPCIPPGARYVCETERYLNALSQMQDAKPATNFAGNGHNGCPSAHFRNCRWLCRCDGQSLLKMAGKKKRHTRVSIAQLDLAYQ